MSEIDKLRQQMAKIIQENPAPKATSYDREILFYEDELRQSGLSVDVECPLVQLSSSLGSVVFNSQHGFSGQDYALLFDQGTLSVLNQKSGAKKRLLDCPANMKESISPYLSLFADKIFQQIGENLE